MMLRYGMLLIILAMLAGCIAPENTTPVEVEVEPGTAPSTTTIATETPIPEPDATSMGDIIPYIVDRTPVTPTPFCEVAPPTRMIVHELGRVTSTDTRPLNVRSGPGTSNRTIGTLQIEDTFLVLEGPVCGETYVWYRIQRDDLEGWVAEGDANVYYIEPYLPG